MIQELHTRTNRHKVPLFALATHDITRQYIRTSGWSVNSADRGHKFKTGVAGVAGVIVRRGHSHGSIRPAMQNTLWKLHEIIYLYILYLSTMIFFTVFAWSLWMLCDGIQSLVQCVWFDHLVPDTMHPYASLGDLGEQRVRCAQRSCALLVHEPTF